LKFTNQTPSVGMRTWSHKHNIISCYTWFLMKGKTQGHGFYQNMEMELNVDQILVKPTIEGFIKSKASSEFFFFFFFMILADTHWVSWEIMKVDVLKNETQKEWALCFSESYSSWRILFCAVKCHYKSFPSNTLCFWHVINVSANLPKISTTTSHQK